MHVIGYMSPVDFSHSCRRIAPSATRQNSGIFTRRAERRPAHSTPVWSTGDDAKEQGTPSAWICLIVFRRSVLIPPNQKPYHIYLINWYLGDLVFQLRSG